MGIIDNLEKIRKNFVWCGTNIGRKVHWISLSKITMPKVCGGFGLGSIRAMNLSLLSKWAWRLKKEAGSLWARVIEGIHDLRNKHWSIFSHRARGGVWRNIDQNRLGLKKLNVLPDEIVKWNDGTNTWESDFEIDGSYRVSLIRNRVDRASLPICDGPFFWIKKIPLKIIGFVWRAKQEKIPSAMALKFRGVPMDSTLCVNCIGQEESSDHLLASCPLAELIWDGVFDWCEIQQARCNKVADFLTFISRWSSCSRKRSLLAAIIYCGLWCIWNGRNQRIFNNCPVSTANILERIKSLTFIWWKHRGKKSSLDWRIWVLNPFLCL